jgi:iron complex outermembrane receptor protein
MLKVTYAGLGIALALFVGETNAQNRTFSGTVQDASTGASLNNVLVFSPGGNTYVQTNFKGEFHFTPGNRTDSISFRLLGYESISFALRDLSTSIIEVSLSPVPFMQKTYEISSLRAGYETPVASTVLEREQLAENNLGKDLPILLDRTPSVVVHSDAGAGVGYTGIRIRGTDATRTNVTLNGIPVNDSESQGVFWVNMPDLSSSIASVQVQRGVGTSTHGAGAFGATIHIQTNELKSKPFANIMSSVGSFNTFRNTVEAGTGILPGGFTVDARLSKITSDGFIDRAFSDLRSFYLSAGWHGKKSSLRFNVLSGKEVTYQAWYGIPMDSLSSNPRLNLAGTDFGLKANPYSNETDNYQQDHYQLFFNHTLNNHWGLNVAAYYTRGRGYFEQYKVMDSLGIYGIPTFLLGGDSITHSDLIRQLWLDNHLVGANYAINGNIKALSLTLGGGGNHYIGNHFGKVIWAGSNAAFEPSRRYYDDLPAYKNDFNQFVKAQLELIPGLSAFADLQYRLVQYQINGFPENQNITSNETYHFFNPKAGLHFSWNEHHSAYLYYGIANREPNRVDFETTEEMKPVHETLRDLELGYHFTRTQARFSANVYWMDYTNQLVLTGQINNVGAYTRTNAKASYRLGIELEWALSPLKWLEIGGNLTLSRNRIHSFTAYIDDYDTQEQKAIDYGETDIAFSPSIISAIQVVFKPFKGANIGLHSKYVGEQYLDNTSENNRLLPAFFVQDLSFNYGFQLFKSGPHLSLRTQIYNVFNHIYAPNGYSFTYISGGEMNTENYVYPMAGIHFLSGIQIKF